MKQGLVPLVHLTIKTIYSYTHIDMYVKKTGKISISFCGRELKKQEENYY